MTEEAPRPCTTAPRAMSGAAALSDASALDGVPVTVRELLALAAMPDAQEIEEGDLLVLGRALGYEVAAMEGGFDDLKDVRVPILVALHDGEKGAYGLLHSFDATGAVVGDPRTGTVTRWARDKFESDWTGSVVQIVPRDEERKTVLGRLGELRDPWKRLRRALGWEPPYLKPLGVLFGGLAAFSVAALSPRESVLDGPFAWLVAAACATSLWSWLGSDACSLCSRAKSRAGGLSLAQAGVLLYGGLLAAPHVAAPEVVVGVLIAAALGGHAALVSELGRAKIACPACILTATFVAAAAAASFARGDAPPAPFFAAMVVALLLVLVLLPWARARAKRRGRAVADSLAAAVLAEPAPPGRVRVVVFKRKGCSACALYEAAVRPALMATFDEEIVIDERDLGARRTQAPLVMVIGRTRTMFVGLPRNAVEPVLDAVRGAQGDAGASELRVVVAE